MIRLENYPSICDQYRIGAKLQADKARADFIERAKMVIELVHTANLGELPPAPAMLEWKAEQLGLI